MYIIDIIFIILNKSCNYKVYFSSVYKNREKNP